MAGDMYLENLEEFVFDEDKVVNRHYFMFLMSAILRLEIVVKHIYEGLLSHR